MHRLIDLWHQLSDVQGLIRAGGFAALVAIIFSETGFVVTPFLPGDSLLFVAGVMNLLWVAAIAIFVLAEKLGPGGRTVGRATGLLLVAWGVWVVAAGRS